MTDYKSIDNFIQKVANAKDKSELEALTKPEGGVDSQDRDKDTALSYAAIRGNEVATNWLIENGANINNQNKWNQTPLIHAVLYRKIEIIKILLNKNADTSIESLDGIALDIAKKKYEEYKSYQDFVDQYLQIINLISPSLNNNLVIKIETWNSYNSSQKANILKEIFDSGYNITKYKKLFSNNMKSFENNLLLLKDSNWYIYELVKHDVIDIEQPQFQTLKDRYENISSFDSIIFFIYHIIDTITNYFTDDGKLSYVEEENISIAGEDLATKE